MPVDYHMKWKWPPIKALHVDDFGMMHSVIKQLQSIKTKKGINNFELLDKHRRKDKNVEDLIKFHCSTFNLVKLGLENELKMCNVAGYYISCKVGSR